jgi:hypothetical protein
MVSYGDDTIIIFTRKEAIEKVIRHTAVISAKYYGLKPNKILI